MMDKGISTVVILLFHGFKKTKGKHLNKFLLDYTGMPGMSLLNFLFSIKKSFVQIQT